MYVHAGMLACIDIHVQVISVHVVVDHQSASAGCKGLHPIQHNSTGRG